MIHSFKEVRLSECLKIIADSELPDDINRLKSDLKVLIDGQDRKHVDDETIV